MMILDPSIQPRLHIRYVNYRANVSERIIRIKSVRFGTSQWHTQAQWLALAWDFDKAAEREFALADIEVLRVEQDRV